MEGHAQEQEVSVKMTGKLQHISDRIEKYKRLTLNIIAAFHDKYLTLISLIGSQSASSNYLSQMRTMLSLRVHPTVASLAQ